MSPADRGFPEAGGVPGLHCIGDCLRAGAEDGIGEDGAHNDHAQVDDDNGVGNEEASMVSTIQDPVMTSKTPARMYTGPARPPVTRYRAARASGGFVAIIR